MGKIDRIEHYLFSCVGNATIDFLKKLRFFDIARWDLGPEVLDGPLYGSRLGTLDANGVVT